MYAYQPAQAANPHRPRRRRRVLFSAMGALAFLSIGAGQFSLALFTDQETVPATLTAGSIDLDGTEIDNLVLTTSAFMPNSSVTDDVVVSNVGTGQLRYSMTTSSTNADAQNLRDVLTLTVKTVDASTPGTPCNDFDGTSVLAATVLGASTAAFGSPTSGAQAGDRTLDAAASETLCFRVTLPQGTGNAYQSAATTTTFTFDGEQTANNP